MSQQTTLQLGTEAISRVLDLENNVSLAQQQWRESVAMEDPTETAKMAFAILDVEMVVRR